MLRVDDFRQLSVADHFLVHPHLDRVLEARVLLRIVADDDGQRRSPRRNRESAQIQPVATSNNSHAVLHSQFGLQQGVRALLFNVFGHFLFLQWKNGTMPRQNWQKARLFWGDLS